MFTYRGRGGPSRSTPANVTCQKCLKKGHYSYECKSSTQERPYKSRPSRSQQLRNPKLVPELTNDKPDPIETKQGVADAELAKKEAERARKRELEQRDDELVESVAKRRRSISSESVSTISTRSSRSASPRRHQSASPRPGQGQESRDRPRGRPRSSSRSVSPPTRTRHDARTSRSPAPRDSAASFRHRPSTSGSSRERAEQREQSRRSYTSSMSRSRSPIRDRKRDEDLSRGIRREHGDDRGRRGHKDHIERTAARSPPRQRSLSPFSKRLALTKLRN